MKRFLTIVILFTVAADLALVGFWSQAAAKPVVQPNPQAVAKFCQDENSHVQAAPNRALVDAQAAGGPLLTNETIANNFRNFVNSHGISDMTNAQNSADTAAVNKLNAACSNYYKYPDAAFCHAWTSDNVSSAANIKLSNTEAAQAQDQTTVEWNVIYAVWGEPTPPINAPLPTRSPSADAAFLDLVHSCNASIESAQAAGNWNAGYWNARG
jgi:hypothetical protein